MKPSFFKLLILFLFILFEAYGQELASNKCDSTLLTKEEYEKCKSDTAWRADILIKTNYLIKFKTELLPKYRVIRRGLDIPSPLKKSLQKLKLVYDSVLHKKISKYQIDMDRNQKYMQPKAYLSSMLSLQMFNFYPDIYSILFNDIHLHLSPKTTIEEQKFYKDLFDETIKKIPSDLNEKLVKITSKFIEEQNKLMGQNIVSLFRGEVDEEYRNQYNSINFLIWIE